jgi:hypothetical protein
MRLNETSSEVSAILQTIHRTGQHVHDSYPLIQQKPHVLEVSGIDIVSGQLKRRVDFIARGLVLEEQIDPQGFLRL